MSNQRQLSYRSQPLVRGPNGGYLCRWCRKECPGKRRTYCSQGCLDEWLLRSRADVAAEQVFERDKGVCAECGVDCELLFRNLRGLPWGERRELCRQYGIPIHRLNGRRIWDVDHVEEVARGGGACGLENLQTLCIPCHARKTARFAAERAASKKP